jgi:hypothetical protein
MEAGERVNVAPRLLGPYLERRASGHAGWIAEPVRWVNRVLQRQDRGNPMPQADLPNWVGARASPTSASRLSSINVGRSSELMDALAAAKAGDTITLAPGRYRFSGRSLEAMRPGMEDAPITVRADAFGTVVLEFDLLEGFHVTAPYWVFENLVIRGACASHDACEHAFHVVGGAHHVVIRNNALSDFNAHIKINGSDGRFPDNGRILNNTLTNATPRKTSLPVTPIDLVAASRWLIEGNLLADFVKDGGDATSYGAFAKGGGSDNTFARNVVICEARLRGAPGRRVGLSFGGGGSDQAGCRDRRCVVEHENGRMLGNLIASCSDDGVYVNRSSGSKVLYNTLLDTAGVEIRFPESTAMLSANLIDGAVRVRDDGILRDEGENDTTPVWALYLGWHPVRNLFADAGNLDLRFTSAPPPSQSQEVSADLCSSKKTTRTVIGAFDTISACLQAPTR